MPNRLTFQGVPVGRRLLLKPETFLVSSADYTRSKNKRVESFRFQQGDGSAL
jgi:hypothetical protein